MYPSTRKGASLRPAWIGSRPVFLPGINRETYYDDSDYVDEFYDIVVPHDFLHPEICEGWIKRLNQQYDKDFQLEYSQQS